MPDRILSVGDDFTLRPEVKVADTNLPATSKAATLKATYGDVVFAKEFGAVGDGVTDDTAALQAGIDAAAARGVPFRIHAGTFKLTDQLLFASKQDIGGVRGVTILKQYTPGKAVLCSRNYIAGQAGPAGQVSLHDMIVTGEGTSATSHGIIFRDYLSQIERIIITECGGNGLHMTTLNSSGAAYGGASLVDNRITEVDTRNCHGWGIFIGELDSNKYTDGYMHHCYVSNGSGAPGAIYFGSTGGWKLGQLHTYGTPGEVGIELQNLNNTEITGLYIEAWNVAGLRLGRIQRNVNIGSLQIRGATISGGSAVDLASRSSVVTEASVIIAQIHLMQDNDVPVNGVKLETSTIKCSVTQFGTDGAFPARITKFSGFAASTILHSADTSLTTKVRQSASGNTLTVRDIPIGLTGRSAWAGAGSKSVTLAVPDLGTNQVVHGSLAVVSIRNYNGSLSAQWRADLILTSKASGDAWSVYTTAIIAPTGFVTAPTVTVDKAAKLITVTFEATATDGYGTVGMSLEYT